MRRLLSNSRNRQKPRATSLKLLTAILSDYTPDVLNWTQAISSIASHPTPTYANILTVTGIDTAIQLSLTFPASGYGAGEAFLYVKKNGTVIDTINCSSYPGASAINLSETVSSGDTIQFGYSANTATSLVNIVVKNVSDSDTQIDTFRPSSA